MLAVALDSAFVIIFISFRWASCICSQRSFHRMVEHEEKRYRSSVLCSLLK